MSPLLRRKRDATDALPHSETLQLSAGLPLLEVIRDYCSRGGRFSLVVQSDDLAYTVLIDRGGVFNVTGSGLQGSDALTAASRLTSGRCTVTEGWPVAQPLYQHGLDVTLQELLGGTRIEKQLPQARGVEALRQIEAGGVSQLLGDAPAPAATAPPPLAPPPSIVPVDPPAPPTPITPAPRVLPLTPAAQAPEAATPVVPIAVSPPPLAPPPSIDVPEPPAPRIVLTPPPIPGRVPSPVEAPAQPEPAPARPEPEPVLEQQPVAVQEPVPLVAAAPEKVEPATPRYTPGLMPEMRDELQPVAPQAAPAKQGPIKSRLTTALLWLVSVEDPQSYNLKQARHLVWVGFTDGVRGMFRPFTHLFVSPFRRAKEDWEKSGELVARQRAREQKSKPSIGKAHEPGSRPLPRRRRQQH